MQVDREPTLRSVNAKLSEWRKVRKSGRERIPEGLWDEIVFVAVRGSRTAIAKELGLNSGRLSSEMALRSRAEQPKSAQLNESIKGLASGISVTKVISVATAASVSFPSIEVTSPTGWMFRLPSNVSSELLCMLMSSARGAV